MTKKGTLFRDPIDRIKPLFSDDFVDVERPLWDSVAQEPARLSGQKFRMYSLRRAKNRHPLYGEATDGNWSFHGPWEFYAAFEFDQTGAIQQTNKAEGRRDEADAKMWVARKELEDVSAPEPKIGDVIEFWDREGFKRAGGFQFWEVTKATPDGNMVGDATFVQWVIELKAKSDFDPERKVE